jgi:hypothetical protein
MVLCKWGEAIVAVVDLYEPQRHTHNQKRFGGTASER